MEKLQMALEKARRERKGAAAPGEPPVYTRPNTGPQPTASKMIWGMLEDFEPNPKVLVDNHILTWTAHPDANPFDVLRTKIYLLMKEHGWKRLAITSPDKGCGKSTLACNLAAGFTRQQELKSLLFDFDLRRPSVARLLGMEPEHDIAKLLRGEVSALEQMKRLRANVAVSAARAPITDPTQLLLSHKTAQLLDTLENDFAPDVMIFDLPPMLVTDDARAVLRNVDCTLIVAGAGQTRIGRLDVCEREVAELTNVVGVVLNSCRHIEPSDSYYY